MALSRNSAWFYTVTLQLTGRMDSRIDRSQWPRGLTRESAAARVLGLRVRMQPKAWMSVCCECCLLSGRSVCEGPIPRPQKSYRVWCARVCVAECDRRNNNSIHLQRVGREGSDRERKKGCRNRKQLTPTKPKDKQISLNYIYK
jgi:hypothetical protein